MMIGLYFSSGQLGLTIPNQTPALSLIWLPSGIAVFAIQRFGRPMISACFLGAMLLNLQFGHPFSSAVILSTCSTAGPGLCCWLLRKQGFDPYFSRRRDVAGFTIGILAGNGLSSTLGMLWLHISLDQAPPLISWLTWWAGDLAGTLLLAPLLWNLSRRNFQLLGEQWTEVSLFFVLFCATNWFIFLSEYNRLPLKFVTAFLMIWPALRLNICVAAMANLIAALFAAWSALQNLTPFGNDGAGSLFTLWGYICILSLITLTTTALQAERVRAGKEVEEAYQRMHKIASRLPGLILQYRILPDKSTSIPFASAAIWSLLELQHDEVRADAMPIFQRVHPDDREHGLQVFKDAIQQMSPWQNEFRYVRRDGSVRWLYIDGLPEKEMETDSILWHCFITDITERKQAESELRIAACTFESQEGIFVTDATWRILKINQAFTRISGFEPADLQGQLPPRHISASQSLAFFKKIQATLDEMHYWHGEIWNIRKDGSVYPMLITLTAILDERGTLTNYIGSFTDVSRNKGYEAEIRNLAFYDSLTQLPNRRLLMDRLSHLISISQRNQSHSAILFIDLDNFKTLNDTRGHDAGDLLLVETSRRLSSCVRDSDTVARLGGDEFVVVLEELSEQRDEAMHQADKIAEKIRQTLSEPYQIADFEHHGSSSIGVCMFSGSDTTVKDLFKRADTAMYEAKTAGRNAVRFFDPAMQAILIVRMMMESNLRIALSQQQFELHYQCQVNADRKLIGAEALLRWRHPDRGYISPAEFIPLAEETGLIVAIGNWVLETACAQLKQWEQNAATAHLSLAVNVSAKQFQQSDFVELVTAMVKRHAFNPAHLKIELTESTILDNVDATTEKMSQLGKSGIGFSMDDFGTGYSSLAYLQRLPLNQLKIDQSFVRDLSEDENDATIVRTIISLGINLGLHVIAEGVETEAQHNFLLAHHCHAFQGYLYSKPLPLHDFLLLASQQEHRPSGASHA
ncbi:EAL domain-containing protein [Undibacterium rugosum]|uniref:bifunctional diguanylate cyclase/phosphodiesterase n=1 Tax=Undibacterium rugosum TaxID=2762291 RepID=UPI001B82B174|nr:EAL domain-containing protein [Undibacterium rugosum]MBR7777696.1 EAL domain-containing protein [Undibacterium rugosum]